MLLKHKLSVVSIAIACSMFTPDSEATEHLNQVNVDDLILRSDLSSSIESTQITELQSHAIQTASPLTIAIVADFILKEAKSAMLKKARSFLSNAIFGNGGNGPQFVMLHQEALDQINNIVKENIVNADVESAKSDLQTLGELIAYYHESVKANNPDLALLADIKGRAFDLKNHKVYRSSYNTNAKLMTSSYALISSLTIAIVTEEFLQGKLSKSYVSSLANDFQNNLSNLGNSVDIYINQRVFVQTDRPISYCWQGCLWQVHDLINGRPIISFSNSNDATAEKIKKINKYKDQLKGKEYISIASSLDELSRL